MPKALLRACAVVLLAATSAAQAQAVPPVPAEAESAAPATPDTAPAKAAPPEALRDAGAASPPDNASTEAGATSLRETGATSLPEAGATSPPEAGATSLPEAGATSPPDSASTEAATDVSPQAPEPAPAEEGAFAKDTGLVPEGTPYLPPHIEDYAKARALAEQTERSAPALVVSGGISLGAYQAGFISTLVRFWSVAQREGARADLGNPAPRVWTGASAGAVNALLGGLASCDTAFSQPRWSPEQSLFWTVWIDQLDLERLLPKEPTGPNQGTHLFSEPHMQDTLRLILEKAQTTRFKEDCTFAYGITVTNLRGRDVPFGEGGPESQFKLKRVTEKLVVQVMTQGEGKLTARLPFMEGAVSASFPHIGVKPKELAYYPALGAQPKGDGGHEVSLSNLLLTPQASGAFPLAFPPVPVEVSFFNETQWGPVEALKLIDGGVLNNNPVDLAVRLGSRWVERGSAGETTLNRERFPVVYLDQDAVGWSWAPPPARPKRSRSPLDETYFQYLGNVLNAARDSAVLNTLEHDINLSGRIQIPRRTSVLPSEFQFAMMGFFDRRFREHDFYRGMQDAIRFLSTQLTSTRAVDLLVPRVEKERLRDREVRVLKVLGIDSAGFNCVVGNDCAATPQLERLRMASDELTDKAQAGQLNKGQVDVLLAALGDVGYQYSEGVMEGAEATGTREDLEPVRQRVGTAFHSLVSQQKGNLKIPLRPAGAAFLDEWLTYSKPSHVWTLSAMRQRGVGLGVELPFGASEQGREEYAYSRNEWRFGAVLSALGVRDMDQLVPNDTRIRWGTLGLYIDCVSDMDGFSGAIPFLDLGPYVRWRAGLGVSAGYLREPNEWALTVPEARLGVDLAEMVGVRLTVPVYLLKRTEGDRRFVGGTPKYFKELGLGVEFLLTRW
ncbi:patatin-like phospholipase family protein [Corallococcus macrosporus]|uniref:patatin-like phospholipase family protein n=1 Tax=Corallococcus macrosporus TaxID=35 RepID=UPI0005BB0024|nr:patatin-like phospholipase family protein [Corallococcus macrosporus]